eukprot:m.120689 g.120689  ORF g.120689 m.120689 type:complete len:207 (-) comp9373_c0_seq18:1267-1887(-)
MEQLSQSSTKDVFDLFNKIGEHTNCLRLRAEESEKQCLILNELLDGYRRKEDMATVSMQKQQYNCIHCAEMKQKLAILSHEEKLAKSIQVEQIMSLTEENCRLKEELECSKHELMTECQQKVMELKSRNDRDMALLRKNVVDLQNLLQSSKRKHNEDMEATKKSFQKKFGELAAKSMQTPDVYKKKLLALKKSHALQISKLRNKKH